MAKSPLALGKEVLMLAERALPPYSHRFSRRDFTQAQLFAILTLRQLLARFFEFFKTDYRSIVQMLEDFSDLSAAVGLKKVPHHPTPSCAQQRLPKKGGFRAAYPSLSRPHKGAPTDR